MPNEFFEPFSAVFDRLIEVNFSGGGRTTLKNSGRAAPRLTNVLGGQVTGMDQRRTTLDDPHSTRIEKTRLVSVLGWGRRGKPLFQATQDDPHKDRKS